MRSPLSIIPFDAAGQPTRPSRGLAAGGHREIIRDVWAAAQDLRADGHPAGTVSAAEGGRWPVTYFRILRQIA